MDGHALTYFAHAQITYANICGCIHMCVYASIIHIWIYVMFTTCVTKKVGETHSKIRCNHLMRTAQRDIYDTFPSQSTGTNKIRVFKFGLLEVQQQQQQNPT